MIVSGSNLVLRSRPKRYKADGAAYAVGGNRGYYLAFPPKPYPKTPQQKRIGAVAAECGIKSGISKAALMTAMKDCVKGKFNK